MRAAPPRPRETSSPPTAAIVTVAACAMALLSCQFVEDLTQGAGSTTQKGRDTLVARSPIPDQTELELEVTGTQGVRGTAPVFAECRVVPAPGGGASYEVATTPGEFEGSVAALGVLVRGYRGPGSYTDSVTVTLSLEEAGEQPRILSGRGGCVARVEDQKRGSFSCDTLRLLPRQRGALPGIDTSDAPRPSTPRPDTASAAPPGGADRGAGPTGGAGRPPTGPEGVPSGAAALPPQGSDTAQVMSGLRLAGRGSWRCW